MDILCILGQNIRNESDLVHIYNRLVLDNHHVRNCANQSLYNLCERFDTLKCIDKIIESLINKIMAFFN